jgi:signal peptidase II
MVQALTSKLHLLIWPSLGVFLLDRITKMAVLQKIDLYDSITVIPGLMNLVHVRNRGMAFGMMNRPDLSWSFYLLLAAGLTAVVLLIFWLIKLKEEEILIVPGLSLILGGAVGNLLDRILYREVIDFLDFYMGAYHWPAFNIADSAITVGTIWVVIFLLFQKNRRAD